MRKSILTLIIFLTQILIFGQNYNTTLGIKLSPGIATIYNSMAKDVNLSRFSASGGLVVTQRIFKDKLYLESGLNFIDRGFKSHSHLYDLYGNDLGISKGKEIEYYLELPISIIFKYKGFFVGAGPNINYYLLRRFIVDGKLISTGKSYQPHNFIFGGQFFLGYELKLSNKFIMSFDGYVHPTFKVQFINYGLDIGIKYIVNKQKENE